MLKQKWSRWFFVILTVILISVSFIQLPYYVTKPGMAHDVEPMVEVEGGFDAEGTFMLTTVRLGKANVYSFLLAKVNKYQYLYQENEIRRTDETEEEYHLKQLQMMENSRESAIEVAYKKAGKEINYQYKGVIVIDIYPGMPAEGKLELGDRIIAINQMKVKNAEQFISYVSSKKEGDSIRIQFIREGKQMEETLTVAPFPQQPNKVGIGIGLVDDKNVQTNPQIEINTEEIGGPSAGLMMSLEIYNQLTKKDITKGYKIAGTGTIDSEGNVGRIGGIEQKVVAAHEAGADIFFAPNDPISKEVKQQNHIVSNYEAALKTARDIETNMKIVPVTSFEEALAYLEKLPPKEK
jgi:Lon-like protease